MRQRTSIVLTSILKPVDDTRMFEKFGLSLSQTNKYEVNIIGFAAKNLKKVDNIHFYPLFNFRRLSLLRLFVPFRLLYYLFKVKPSIIIFNTPEILYVIILYKLIAGCQIIYDIQENYFRNIYYNKNYILPVRFLLSYLILLKEWSGRWLIDRIIFAEEGYKLEMPRSARRAVVIRNTYKDINPESTSYVSGGKDMELSESITDKKKSQELNGTGNIDDAEPIAMKSIRLGIGSEIQNQPGSEDGLDNPEKRTFLFSGTISENYGVFTAIDFIDAMHSQDASNKLLIAGFCANDRVYRKLIERIENKDYIKLIGGDHLVPHAEIIHHIKEADYGLNCYEINPSTENCFPTKIYEYMANQLPIVIQNYQPWSSYCLRHNSGIEIDYKKFDSELLLSSLRKEKFYRTGVPYDIFWDTDEEKLMQLMKDIQT